MKSIFCLLIMLSIFQLEKALSQELQFDMVGKKMSDYSILEKKLKSKIYEADGDIIIPGGMAMPISYKRMQNGVPDLIVSYTFTEKDSLIHEIHYTWDPRNFEKDKNNSKPITFDTSLIKKYNEILAYLTEKYGKSESEGELVSLAKIESNTGLTRSDSWLTKDKIKIYMSIILSNKYKFGVNDKSASLHKIDIYVSPSRK